MKCKACNTPMSSEHVDAELIVSQGVKKIDVRVTCPDCGQLHYKFITVDDLIIDGDLDD